MRRLEADRQVHRRDQEDLTAPQARGLGIARKILRGLEAGARSLKMKRVRLDTNRALTEAHALYRGEGYHEVERFNDNPYAHHWFSKTL